MAVTAPLRTEAFRIMDREGLILETARDLTRLFDDAGIEAAVVGGVAVVLHGYLRTTADVDVYVGAEAQAAADLLRANGYEFDDENREFRRGVVPVHFVRLDQINHPPRERPVIEGVRTVSLSDLINMKLRSGTRFVHRAKDLADVVELIRARSLGTDFAALIDKSLRPEFKRLARAVERGT